MRECVGTARERDEPVDQHQAPDREQHSGLHGGRWKSGPRSAGGRSADAAKVVGSGTCSVHMLLKHCSGLRERRDGRLLALTHRRTERATSGAGAAHPRPGDSRIRCATGNHVELTATYLHAGEARKESVGNHRWAEWIHRASEIDAASTCLPVTIPGRLGSRRTVDLTRPGSRERQRRRIGAFTVAATVRHIGSAFHVRMVAHCSKIMTPGTYTRNGWFCCPGSGRGMRKIGCIGGDSARSLG